jgi:pimeloyl-ACP methyl ester carboxylesterase
LGENVAVTRLVVAALLLSWGVASQSGSARMQLEVGPGLVAEASYWPGELAKPAVLILHGFLQTRESPTVHRLATALADDGYSVLTPTLSLGIPQRSQSLACEAVHTHSLEQDVTELASWTRWLAEHAGKPPVLIGHSTGGILVTALLDSDAGLPVDQAVLISLTAFGDGFDAAERLESAELLQAAGTDTMRAFPLSYCQDYVTTPGRYLSYLRWDRLRVERTLRATRTPVTVILGDVDRRSERSWLRRLSGHGIGIRSIPNADHFFDVSHESDLYDEVIRVTEGLGHG